MADVEEVVSGLRKPRQGKEQLGGSLIGLGTLADYHMHTCARDERN